MEPEENIDLKEVPCLVALPAELEIPVKIEISNGYDISVYTGTKPATLEEKPKGRLISKGPIGRSNAIIYSGLASFFIISKDGKAVYTGNIGISGCALNLSDTSLIKGGSFTVDKL